MILNRIYFSFLWGGVSPNGALLQLVLRADEELASELTAQNTVVQETHNKYINLN